MTRPTANPHVAQAFLPAGSPDFPVRRFISDALSILLITISFGCASPKQAEQKAAKPPPRKATAAVVAPEPPPQIRLLPLNARIASVNDKLRFVVIDFTNCRRPELEQRLSVYRVGQKVAEIKVCGPYQNTTVAADLIAGEAKYGDEVKSE